MKKKGVVAVSFIILFLLLFSFASVSAFSISDFFGKLTGNVVSGNSNGDCIDLDSIDDPANALWNGINNTLGLNRSLDSTELFWPSIFLCYDGRIYSCTLSGLDESIALAAPTGNRTGDWYCSDSGWENASSSVNDGICNYGENCLTVPSDCGDCCNTVFERVGLDSCDHCGDGTCALSETCASCTSDCGSCTPNSYCGDGTCNILEQQCGNDFCFSDCSSACIYLSMGYCGDGTCVPGESDSNCPTDCGSSSGSGANCGDNVCSAGVENCFSCSGDCGVCDNCGDSICSQTESCVSCNQDCGPCISQGYCGDGACAPSESCSSCASDCGDCCNTIFENLGLNSCDNCGDGTCAQTESCASCNQDCGPCISQGYCGDGTCVPSESCISCNQDCGACSGNCGDGTCTILEEQCGSGFCSNDCGPSCIYISMGY